jgi:DNA-binding IclR family transcriptional regulator
LAVSVEETTRGVIGMASPIFAAGGTVIGCVNVSGPAALPPKDVLRVVANDLRYYGALLSKEFGDTTPRAWQDVGPPFE